MTAKDTKWLKAAAVLISFLLLVNAVLGGLFAFVRETPTKAEVQEMIEYNMASIYSLQMETSYLVRANTQQIGELTKSVAHLTGYLEGRDKR